MQNSRLPSKPTRRIPGRSGAHLLFLLLAPAGVAGCEARPFPVEPSATPVDIELSVATLSLVGGQSRQIEATIVGSNGRPIAASSAGQPKPGSTGAGTIVWTTTDPTVAAVAGNGMVTAYGAGETIITASLGQLKKAAKVTVSAPYLFTRASDPNRTVVTDPEGRWLATFTDGAHTVVLSGPQRTFAEPANTTLTVAHSSWVRLRATPFAGSVNEAWLKTALADTTPDILAIATQYVHDAPPIFDAAGLQIAGDAEYARLQPDGTRPAGADWNDYLGVDWVCANGTVRPPREHFFRSLDCTGFIGMVFGYRGGLPVSCRADGTGIPRNAQGAYDAAPGIVVTPHTGAQVTDFSKLQIGDLVFFDAVDENDGARLDHVGFFLGRDSRGHHRFIHSTRGPNGPSFGDNNTRSILETINGRGYWALAFRATRRL